MEISNKTLRKIIFIIVFTIGFAWMVFMPDSALTLIARIGSIIGPFVIGGAIAFIINVPMSAIEKMLFKNNPKLQGLRRPLSLVIALAFCIGVVVFVFVAVIPELARTVYLVAESAPVFLSGIADNLIKWGQKVFEETPQLLAQINSITIDWGGLAGKAFTWLQNGAIDVVGSTITFATGLFGGLFNGFVSFIFAIYLLFSKDILSRQIKMILYSWMNKDHAARTIEIASLSRKAFSSFITGQCIEACVIGLLFVLPMWIFGFPHVMLISVLIGFTALIPIFGAFIGCFVGTFLILVQDPMKALGFLIMFLIIQQIEGNVVYPKIVGKSVGLPSIWVLVSCTIGGSAFGLAGMLIMIPICSVLYAVVGDDAYKKLKSKNLSSNKL